MRWQSTADARGHAGGDEDEMPRPQVDDSIVWVDRYASPLSVPQPRNTYICPESCTSEE